jgi:hypothetical protein
MRYVFGERLKNITAALLLSGLIAGVICALTSPVTANNAAGVTVSVNRTSKGDRLPQTTTVAPVRHDSISSKKTAPSQAPTRTPIGCETAFSPVAHPAHANILTHCAA